MSLAEKIRAFHTQLTSWAQQININPILRHELFQFLDGSDIKFKKKLLLFPFSLIKLVDSAGNVVCHIISHDQIGRPGSWGRIKLSARVYCTANTVEIDCTPIALKIVSNQQASMLAIDGTTLLKKMYPTEFGAAERPTTSPKTHEDLQAKPLLTELSTEAQNLLTIIKRIQELASISALAQADMDTLTQLSATIPQLLSEFTTYKNSISHPDPRVVRIKKYITMPLFGGEELFDLCNKCLSTGRRYSTDTILKIISSLVVQLDKIHNTYHNVHRDIKLENIIADEETGQACLIDTDFALALFNDAPPAEAAFFGTVYYCYPGAYYEKQGRRYEIINYERDVYALYKVIQELLKSCALNEISMHIMLDHVNEIMESVKPHNSETAPAYIRGNKIFTIGYFKQWLVDENLLILPEIPPSHYKKLTIDLTDLRPLTPVSPSKRTRTDNPNLSAEGAACAP
jgi:serine/threonine protein kinase